MVRITKDVAGELSAVLEGRGYDGVFVVTDGNTYANCLPLVREALEAHGARVVTIDAGDVNKDMRGLRRVWEALVSGGASRGSVVVNLGGGMVTDLGGFAAATFKRGVRTVNVPTTLMASVDAAIGGKTGMNFRGLKNEVGAFHEPEEVLIDCAFLATLDRENLLSGYAEMLKHGLLSGSEAFFGLLAADPSEMDAEVMNAKVAESVGIKERIVMEDPHERGIRKALNLGHTVGHALESFSIDSHRTILHGHAVAAGLVCELYLSHRLCGMDIYNVRAMVNYVRGRYARAAFGCKDYARLLELMSHDKKNSGGRINFTLLSSPGEVQIDRYVDIPLIEEALDFYRENV
ncbi:MAG: 3-dehydroquinate synthase [Tannerella sp.]|jgi:3-dehydroquinate synthase|nr:3-dehydroquinate synthase [Tannerella sp.]